MPLLRLPNANQSLERLNGIDAGIASVRKELREKLAESRQHVQIQATQHAPRKEGNGQ